MTNVHSKFLPAFLKNASEKRLVAVGRISTVVLMVLSAILALVLQNALQLFELLLVFGAGTGLVFILRWFWWRINAWTEITAMFASGIISLALKLTPLGSYLFDADKGVFPDWAEFPFVVFITTIIWLLATYLTQPESKEVLLNFYKKTQPGGPGWRKIIDQANGETLNLVQENEKWAVPSGILAMLLGCVFIYGAMFATGYWIYGETTYAVIFTIVSLMSGYFLARVWKNLKTTIL